ncbi:alkaline phosphatase [Elsinoe ampelina]|uniref:alkaline phosphatase n=1 Tax=Elsinoe ampelina TaxID=302913 RepID=A0A6A6GLK0_9PEZI|nr:alkaline phosphatase [Elsinoe ampelina]
MKTFSTLAVAATLTGFATAQSFQRLGACPQLGCIFPPDQTDFLAGQYFDIRLEVHAPKNGSEAISSPPDENFSFTVQKKGQERPRPAPAFFNRFGFNLTEPRLERWNFTWFEDFFAQDAGTPSLVDVTAKAYRKVALYEPGEYEAVLTYYNGSQTRANWLVRDIDEIRRTKNVLLFIGDGMTTNMISAARLIGHKSINGKYQSLMAMDQFPVLGHQMTHSIDSFITDSANSASALYSGHKSSVNALGVYADSSRNSFDDPKVETIAELFYRRYKGKVGIVSTAFIADATPAGLTVHTRDRGQYGAVVDSFLNGVQNYSWTEWKGADVIFGGGAEQFYSPSLGGRTYLNRDYYEVFRNASYNIIQNATALAAAPNDRRTLGIFSVSNMAKWLDRNVYPANLRNQRNSPDGLRNDAIDQPGLKQMTIKAIDILQTRAKAAKDKDEQSWFLMSEAASIDKQMHALDYDRALGELLELDDTIRASIEHLDEIGELENTMIIVTADHGHGFDVYGSADTKYLNQASGDRNKRNAIGVYESSGLSQYQLSGNLTYTDGSFFPKNWAPRYSLAQGVVAFPDRRENFQVHTNGPRTPATNITGFPRDDYYVNYVDAVTGFLINGSLPTDQAQGVHSLTDVPVFAMGPCEELFGGVYNNIDLFYGMAECLGLSRSNPDGRPRPGKGHGGRPGKGKPGKGKGPKPY